MRSPWFRKKIKVWLGAGSVKGETFVSENEQPVAKLVSERLTGGQRPAPGLGKGSILYMAPDFDETPEEFREYRHAPGCLD